MSSKIFHLKGNLLLEVSPTLYLVDRLSGLYRMVLKVNNTKFSGKGTPREDAQVWAWMISNQRCVDGGLPDFFDSHMTNISQFETHPLNHQ